MMAVTDYCFVYRGEHCIATFIDLLCPPFTLSKMLSYIYLFNLTAIINCMI